VNRGEIRWYTFRLPDKMRPVMLLSRTEVSEHLNELIVVPITRTIRGLATEVVLTQGDGMPVTCAMNFDHIALAQKDRIGSTLSTLSEARWPEVRSALLIACGFESSEAS
jgi:mRNA interferase MazF